MSRFAAPLLFGLIGIGILVWLGTWQLQRLEWKLGVLAQIENRIQDAPQPLPVDIDPVVQRYQPVVLQGQFEPDALRVLVSVKRQGAGYRLVSAFVTEAGRRVLVDRGFVPLQQLDAVSAPQEAVVTGNLHWPDDRTSSTPQNDTAGNTWFARDIDAMAAALGTEPLLVIARAVSQPEEGVTPLPVDTSGIPNDHLQYAITWFSLAAVWFLMTAAYVRRLRKT